MQAHTRLREVSLATRLLNRTGSDDSSIVIPKDQGESSECRPTECARYVPKCVLAIVLKKKRSIQNRVFLQQEVGKVVLRDEPEMIRLDCAFEQPALFPHQLPLPSARVLAYAVLKGTGVDNSHRHSQAMLVNIQRKDGPGLLAQGLEVMRVDKR